MGCVIPEPGYLQGLRALCDTHGVVLIFDEVMTGFRLALGGAQERFAVTPDLTTLGKIIGGGLPVGAYGGKKEIMEFVSPEGPVYQAGTLSGNPLAMAAGLAMLNHLKNNPSVYAQIDRITEKLAEGLRQQVAARGLKCTINHVGSMFTLFFTDTPVINYDTAKTCDTQLFAQYFQAMLTQGIYMAPSQFEAMFVSAAITDQVAEQILDASAHAFASMS